MKKGTLLIVIFLSLSLYSNEITKNNNMVFDKETNLMWSDIKDNTLYTWEEAINYCEKLDLGGYNNWEMPNIAQLQSLADYSRYKPAIKKNFKHTYFIYDLDDIQECGIIEKNGTHGSYWSSSGMVHLRKEAEGLAMYTVNFTRGHVSGSRKSETNYIRCVRYTKVEK